MSSEQIDELPTRLVNTSSDEASLRHVNYDTWSSGSSEAVHVSTSSLPLHASDGSKDSNRHSLQTKRLLRQTETADTFGSPQKTSGSEPAMETSRRPVDSSADGNRYFEVEFAITEILLIGRLTHQIVKTVCLLLVLMATLK